MKDKATMIDEIHRFILNSTYSDKEKPLAERTRQMYQEHLTLLNNWMLEQGLAYRTLTMEQMNTYLSSRPWSDSTKHSAVCAARRFYRWKFGNKHPICAMRIKRRDPGPQRTLKASQVRKLFEHMDLGTAKGIRDLALVSLMVDTGLRASEVCSLTLEMLDMQEWSLQVKVKGDRWEPSVFFDFTAKCLQNWLLIRPEIAAEGVKTIFVAIGGIKPGTPITRDGLRAIFRRLGQATGLGLISPHDLRRTFATLAISYGAPTRVVQAAGHWRNIGMVERYTRKLAIKAIQPYSPANQIMGIFRAKSRNV